MDKTVEVLQQEISTYKAWQPNAWDNAQKLSKYEETLKEALFNLEVLNQPAKAKQILHDCLYPNAEVTE